MRDTLAPGAESLGPSPSTLCHHVPHAAALVRVGEVGVRDDRRKTDSFRLALRVLVRGRGFMLTRRFSASNLTSRGALWALVLAAAVAAALIATACDLNPQPLPPGEVAGYGGGDSGAGASTGVAADAGALPISSGDASSPSLGQDGGGGLSPPAADGGVDGASGDGGVDGAAGDAGAEDAGDAGEDVG